MARYTRQSVGTLQGINNELSKIKTAIDDTLSRKGDVPNEMEAPIDMNSERILNLPFPESEHEPLTLGSAQELLSKVTGANIVSEDVPSPALTRQGVRWYKPSEATTYVYYEDGDSGQWVQESIAPQIPVSLALPNDLGSIIAAATNQVDLGSII
jgi:hypothetical protein